MLRIELYAKGNVPGLWIAERPSLERLCVTNVGSRSPNKMRRTSSCNVHDCCHKEFSLKHITRTRWTHCDLTSVTGKLKAIAVFRWSGKVFQKRHTNRSTGDRIDWNESASLQVTLSWSMPRGATSTEKTYSERGEWASRKRTKHLAMYDRSA